MPKPSQADVQYFAGQETSPRVAAALLGGKYADRLAAARALAGLAADRAALLELLATLPGGALAALRVVAAERWPLRAAEYAARLDRVLGAGRGKAAFGSLLGRGFLGSDGERLPRYMVWGPLRAPICEALAGVDLGAAPEAEPLAAPDREGLAVALLLGHLWRVRPKVKQDGALYKRDAAELDRLFGQALGAGVAGLFARVFRALGLLGFEGEELSGGVRLVPGDDGAAFLSQPRAERVRAFAEALILPPWLEAMFSAGQRLVSREALGRIVDTDLGPTFGDAAAVTIGFCVAAGILEELPGGLRIAPELRRQPGPERPDGGRWLVQPNLEVMVPPDVPAADAFRLACVAEIVAIDRAAVLRLTPASLGQAAEAGMPTEEIVGRLEARAGAPLPDLALRAVEDGGRARPAAWVHTGTVVVVPAEARQAVQSRFADCASEIAPRVFLVAEGAEARVRKGLAALALTVRQRAVRYRSTGREDRRYGAKELERLLALPVIQPADARLVRALHAARAGDPAAFAVTDRPVENRPDAVSPPGGGETDVEVLLDELLERMERGEKLHLERVPLAQRQLFLNRLNRVLSAQNDPHAEGPTFARNLALLVRGAAAIAAPVPAPDRPGMPTDASPGDAAHGGVPPLDPAWEPVAARAMAERRDLWLGLAAERRPRLVTAHRVVQRGDGADLLALTHDSGDLRVFPGERIAGAAVGGPSAAAHLPAAATTERPALRAARNERCPCGSGKKYKACCLPADLAAAG